MLAVDSALCGRLPNAEPVLEALGFALQLIYMLMVAMLGLVVGTVSLVARAYGGKAMDRVAELIAQSTQLTLFVGACVGVAGALLARPLFTMLGASEEATDIGVAYLRPMMIGTPFFYVSLLYAGVLRGVGNTRVPFICALGANVINAVLCYGLVLGELGMPALGVEGAAIATVTAQICNALVLVLWMRRGLIPGVKVSLRPRPVDRKLARDLFQIGGPAAIDALVANAGFLVALAMLGRIDPISVSAHGLGLRVQAIAFVPGFSIAQATAAMTGQALGAGSVERARHVARASSLLCALVMTSLGIAITFAAYPLVSVFDVQSGTTLEAYAVQWMQLLGVVMLPAAINLALIGVLQGAGATPTTLRINFWTIVALQIPMQFLFAFGFGWDQFGVWLAFPITFTLRTFVIYAVYKRERWAVTGLSTSAARSGRDAAPAASAADIA
jgi:putative MATE family efflux protein